MGPDANHETLGIYVAVPFCRAKCSFCNFASGVSSPPAIERYVATICHEINRSAETAEHLQANDLRKVDTVYFGGGTPSLLTPVQFRAIFAALTSNFDVAPGAEITMEAAPGQISDELLEEALRLGINRVSLGVQSFVDRESSAVGRTHTQADCLNEIKRLQRAGLCNIGVDLIAGLPFQTEESWRTSLGLAGSVGLSHVSVYMLEVDDDSRLGREVLSGGLRLHAPKVPCEDLVATLYEQACEQLPLHGFPQYEISNFAVGEFQSCHNRKYWERAPYLGFGLDAHSMLTTENGAVRFANQDNLTSYLEAARKIDPVRVGQAEALEESIFLGLRLIEGVSIESLQQRFPQDCVTAIGEAAKELMDGGLMRLEGQLWQLTARGRLLSNDVFTHLLMGVAA